MKTIKLNQTLGYYTPGFYKLYIAMLKPIDPRNLNSTELSTFVHEYTHFLQDFTTLNGLENTYILFEWLRLFVTETYKFKKIDVPVEFSHETIEIGSKIWSHAYGSEPEDELDIISSFQNFDLVQTLSADIINKFPQTDSFRTVKAQAITPNGLHDVEIGSLAIMESMSHLAEVLMGFPVPDAPDYPYNAVRLMANSLCPTKNLSDEVLFALCDITLQCSVPGKAMYELLTGIDNGTYPTPNDGYSVYSEHHAAFRPWLDKQYTTIVNMAKDHLTELVHPPMGERYQMWIDNIFNFAIRNRQTNPAFLLDELRNRSYYSNIVNIVGTPLMVNAVEDYRKTPAHFGRSFPSEMDVEFFPALSFIMDIFNIGKRECPMQEWCQSSGIQNDNNCITNPPARSNVSEYPQLCPVGAIWRSWNLSSYQYNKQHLLRTI